MVLFVDVILERFLRSLDGVKEQVQIRMCPRNKLVFPPVWEFTRHQTEG